MKASMVLKRLLACVLLWPAAMASGQPGRTAELPQRDPVAALLTRIEQAAMAGDPAAILALCDSTDDQGDAEEMAVGLTTPVPGRVVVNERDRTPLDSRGLRLMVEVFAERGIEGRLSTWRLDVRPGNTAADPWRIGGVTHLSLVTGLYRLALNPAKEFEVRDLTVRAPGLTLTMSNGLAFVADTPEGPTAVVLLGRARLQFAPPGEAERTQLRIFGGEETLTTDLDAAFIRVRPSDFDSTFESASLRSRSPSQDDLRRAGSVFDDYLGRTLQIDLSDISRDHWSLTPTSGDLIVEMRTRKHGTLTYARSNNDAEDVSLFDRRRRRNISIYASDAKLARRGPFYNEDDLVDYDVLAYDIDAEITPDRELINGNARIKIRINAPGTSTLTFRLAETLGVRGVYSPDFGRLLHLRVVGQTSLIVNLPTVVTRGTEMWVDIVYGGRLTGQSFDREAIDLGQEQELSYVPLEPRLLFSNRSYWYPQSVVTDYATAKMRITVPGEFSVIASGDPVGPPAPPPGVVESGRKPRLMYIFDAAQPVRYLACVISRFIPSDPRRVVLAPAPAAGTGGPGGRTEVSLYVRANPRQSGRAREKIEEATAILQFYGSIAGDAPYPSFTLAVTEGDRPGGHSPPYFAMLNQVVTANFTWQNDPVNFDNYPSFFLAHELAHQWWGHAVGWKNYHEQWISEGFAQYFAALYAEKARTGQVLSNLLRQMRQTAITASSQGPVYLGYRLGHIQGDDRIFRAIVYNKGAMVLHMLRRLVGDRAFFAGLRRFYADWRFRKAGTDDFRASMEAESGRDLRPFFETWIYGTSIPRVKFGYQISGQEARVVFEQRTDPVVVPVTVTITYTTGSSEDIVVQLTERTTEQTIALKAAVRTIVANADNAALVDIER
jgi:hypothetical protein